MGKWDATPPTPRDSDQAAGSRMAQGHGVVVAI